jgi:anti-anti-sigma factor
MAFSVTSETIGGIARATLSGELDASVAGDFKSAIEQLSTQHPKRLVLFMDQLEYMSSAGLRTLVFAKQKMGPSVDIYVIGAHDAVLETIEMTGFQHSVFMLTEYDANEIENV